MEEPLKKKVKTENINNIKKETSRLNIRRNALWNIYVIKLLLVLHFSLHF